MGELGTVCCIAHRGFAAVYPENTITAVERAVRAGADAVEVDVRRCGSGELVVVHDATVDRVSDGDGAVADHPLETLQSLDVLGAGEGIPTLGAVLGAVPDGVPVNVELKESGLAADVLAASADHGADLLVSSFDPDTLREAREAGVVPTALLFGDDPGANLAVARDLGCRAVHPRRDCCDASFVERAHGAGMAVNAWTVASGEVAARLVSAGVDGLIADAPRYCPGKV